MKRFKKYLFFSFFVCCISPKALAQIANDTFYKTIPFTVFKSVDDTHSIEALLNSETLFKSVANISQTVKPTDSYWVRADFSSLLPLLKRDSVWFLQTGTFPNITAYFQDNTEIGTKEYGPFNTTEKYTHNAPRDGVYFTEEHLINNKYLFFKIKRYYPRENIGKIELRLRSAQQKFIESNYYSWDEVIEASSDYLFVGAFFIIFIFTLITYFISKRLDFLFYSLYTLCLLVYLGKSAYDIVLLLMYDYTLFSIWFHSSLQIFINLFYVAFAKHYLETARNYPKLDKAIKIIAVFLGVLIVVNTYLTLILQFDSQLLLMNIHRAVMSFFAIASVVYLLRYGRNALAHIIIVGSLLFTAGALAMLFTQNRHYMMLGCVAELLLFGLGLNYKLRMAHDEKIQLKQIAHENQISALRAQMNPHFIFNSLSSIQHLITLDKKESAVKYLNKFSLLMRNLLESSIEAKGVLAEEIVLLEKYLELESLRFNHAFKYHIDVDENLDAEAVEVPSMLVQPFVENAILHGLLNKKEGDKEINIRFKKNGSEYMLCEIEDNGVGRKISEEQKSVLKATKKSRGIEVTEKRLQLLNLSDHNSIRIIDKKDEMGKPSGTLVQLKILIA